MTYISAYCTDPGSVKRINQDSMCIKAAEYKSDSIILAAVCDGMGGLSEGETASSYIINGLSEWFENNLPDLLRSSKSILEIRENLDIYIHKLNDDLNRYSEITEKVMGTTLSGMIFFSGTNTILTVHIGDTRIYKINNDSIRILTTDHSVISEEIRTGILSPDSADTDSRQNQLTKCIGAVIKNAEYDYSIASIEPDTVYMICSDGFRKKISEQEIHEGLKPLICTDDISSEKALKTLLNKNLERNEIDNITALIVKPVIN